MKLSEFKLITDRILEVCLPKGTSVIKEGRDLSAHVAIGRTAFMDKMGVSSEAEYKQACKKENRIMFHAHIGMSNWKATAKALKYIQSVAEECGFVIDRAGICLDRRMALPKNLRKKARPETGPLLEGEEDWKNLSRVAPIQPHMGDFMIGFPASTENTVEALKVGITTIGNLSQFFSHEAPYWHDHVTTTLETVKALSLMGAFREKGTIVHSYLEDGYGALFKDYCTVAGWAFLEKYIVEDLIGAKLTHCIGGLTCNPVKRAAWVFALDEIHNHDCLGSMIYGDTISFSENYNLNRGMIAEYLTWDIMAQIECPTGHAVHPLPVTEAICVPSAEEIAEAHVFGRRIEQMAKRLHSYIDLEESKTFAKTIVKNGRRVFENALCGLKEVGVDIKDAMQLLYILKKIGPNLFEEMFGIGEFDKFEENMYKPIAPTDVFSRWKEEENKIRNYFRTPTCKKALRNKKIIIASTDVHEHALRLIKKALSDAYVNVINLGAEVDPCEIAYNAKHNDADAIMVSTHNGMALEYCKELKTEIAKQKISIPIFIGGVLNQKIENLEMPLDVTDKIAKLGFIPCKDLKDVTTYFMVR